MSVDIKPKAKLIAKMLGIIVGFSVIGFFLLVIAYMLPRGPIRSHVSKDVEYYSSYHEWGHYLWSTHDDAYSDAYRISIAAGPNDNPIRSAALSLYYEPAEGAEDIFKATNAVYGENRDQVETKEASYARYWHGYAIFLAPLLELFSPAEINVLNYGVQFFLIFALIIVAYRKYGTKLALAVAFYIYALNPVTTAMSFQYAPGFYFSVLPMLAILLFNEKLQQKGRYLLLFTLIGCFINFTDLLSFPLVTLGGPLALSIYLDKSKIKTAKDSAINLSKIVMRSACWAIGYGATWVMKWTIATLVTGENMFADALGAVLNRSAGGGYHRSEAIFRNLETMFNSGTIAICIILLIILLVLWWRKRLVLQFKPLALVGFLFIALYPFIWYCVLVNHSWIHTFMTHRLLAISMFCVALILAKSFSRAPKTKVTIKSKSKRAK